MRVKILQGFVIGHGHFATVGEEIDLPDHRALDAIARGHAVSLESDDETEAPAPPEGEPGEIQQRDPRPTSRDPSLKRGKR